MSNGSSVFEVSSEAASGKLYLKVANADATADWQKVTATAAD
jgi:hypothetical protein